jgi:hypothetical protein
MASITELRIELAALQESLRIKVKSLANIDPRYQTNAAYIAKLKAEIEALKARISEVNAQLIAAQQVGPGTQSAGQITANSQIARDQGANVQAPPAPPVTQNEDAAGAAAAGTVAAGSVDVGTNGRIRTLTETQANPAPTAGATPGQGSGASPAGTINPDVGPNINATPTNSPGVGASPEDAAQQAQSGPVGQAAAANDVVTLANKSARAITPQPNVLDNLSSYTYSVSIYLMSPTDYQTLMTTGKKFVAGYQLLIQSAGGPPVGQEVGAAAQFTASDEAGYTAFAQQQSILKAQGRNQFFPLDYYIDDLEVKSIIPGKGSGGAHNVAEMKFKIIEPYGITLFENLYKATQQYINLGTGASSTVKTPGNYAAQNYLMVIRFYGYDENGNAVITPTTADPAGRSDSRAIIEKFIPFQFSNIKYRVGNRLTEYQCEAVCPQNVIGTGQGRGVIPYNIELNGTTLQNLFNGSVAYAKPGASTAPDKATAAPNPTLSSGLTQALNQFQAEQKAAGVYDVEDVYKVIISHPEIANASIVPPGQTNRLAVPMVNATTGAQAKDGEKQSVQNNAKTVSAIAGMSIVQFLDLAVRSSDYIYKQQTKIINKDNKIVPQSGGAQAFVWYKIGVEAKPIKPDPKRNDFAYEITYEIAPYAINDIKSEFFPKGRFRGAQKQYNYWFTGENTSVLSFEQEFNYLYYVTVNSRQAARTPQGTADYREVEKRIFSPNSAQSNQGEKGNRNEPSANAADYLYSPAEPGNAKLSIVGDPAWIQQGEIWSGVRSTKNTDSEKYDVYFDAFMPDGTINFDSREVLFQVSWNQPADYDAQTGVMNVKGGSYKQQTYIYKATNVTSYFRQGRFTQDLDGVMLLFPDTTTAKAVETASTSGNLNPNVTEATASRTGVDLTTDAANNARRTFAANDPRRVDNTTIPATSVTGTQPTSSLAQGTQQLLTPVTSASAPTLSQLQASPAYITARRNGATPAAALDIARSAFATNSNDTSGTALPGIRTNANTGVVKDQ